MNKQIVVEAMLKTSTEVIIKMVIKTVMVQTLNLLVKKTVTETVKTAKELMVVMGKIILMIKMVKIMIPHLLRGG